MGDGGENHEVPAHMGVRSSRSISRHDTNAHPTWLSVTYMVWMISVSRLPTRAVVRSHQRGTRSMPTRPAFSEAR